jgi:MFS transporter, FSR family, fosmidomycin resistance protein
MDKQITTSASEKPQKSKITILSFGHLVNDLYMNQIQVLLPFWVAAGLSISRGGFLVAAFTITSSLVQPLFGLLSDRRNYGWLVFTGTAWMAIVLGMMGITSRYGLLFIAASLAGLGTAAFHPQASAMVASYSGKYKSFAQAIFIAAGNVGWAITPLLFVPIVHRFGLRVTPVFVFPGLAMSVLLWAFSRNHHFASQSGTSRSQLWSVIKLNFAELSSILFIVAFRSLCYFGLIAFLPLYLKQKGIDLNMSSRMVSLMLFTGSMGGLAGGFLADKYGRKKVLVTSLILSTPLFACFLLSWGWLSILFLAVAGAFLLATFSITVTAAHKIIKNNAGLASGLTLGFGTGIGGLGVGLMGLLADYAGVSYVIYCLISLPILAGLIGLNLKSTD